MTAHLDNNEEKFSCMQKSLENNEIEHFCMQDFNMFEFLRNDEEE
jgi:hypothetical protein